MTIRPALLILIALATPAQAQSIRAVDGDTIAIGRERIRVKGYDTPETTFARCPAERRLGLLAKVRLQKFLTAGPVAIERQMRRDGRPALDKYGRGLAVVRIGGEDVAVLMIRDGLAVPYAGRGRRIDWCARLANRPAPGPTAGAARSMETSK